jgi:sulfite exporter TauE/SafE/copper chaperone CopZ
MSTSRSKQSKPSDVVPQVCTFEIDGIHCAACEVLIDKKMREDIGVKNVDVSLNSKRMTVELEEGQQLKLSELNSKFAGDGYTFRYSKENEKREIQAAAAEIPLLSFGENGELLLNPFKLKQYFRMFLLTLVILAGVLYLDRSGTGANVSITATSSWPAFLVFGLVASVSGCAALVSGVLLSMSKQWDALYAAHSSNLAKAQPHILFLLGRLVSFIILGGVLGAVGGAVAQSLANISLQWGPILVAVFSVVMLILGLQMLGVSWAMKIKFQLPKAITRYAANEKNFAGRGMPIAMGALTFFLPCGFTIIAQTVALTSGSFINGALIMGLFALGTMPALLAISFASIKFNSTPRFSTRFNYIAGLIVVVFALYTFNSQMNLLGLPSLSDVSASVAVNAADLPPIVDGKQILKMSATATTYSPSKLVVRAGIPVVWEVTDSNLAGCTSTLVARDLLKSPVVLSLGVNKVEFVAPTPGTYKFSCSAGHATGEITVV